MITENIKTFTDEEIINLINKIVMGEVQAELADLKAILAEASGRKLEKNYINIIAERIREKIQPQQVEQKRKPELKQEVAETTKKFDFDELYSKDFDDEDDEEYEQYPVLSFLAGLYKVFAWILFAGIIVTGAIVAALFVGGNILGICGVMFAALLTSIIFLLALLGASENIKLKIDIERHLSKLK